MLDSATTVRSTPAPAAGGALREVARERGFPVVGVLPMLLRDPPSYLSSVARAHPGELVAIRVGPIWVYLISKPAHVQQVLVDNVRNYGKGRMWDATRQLFGNGLLRSEGAFWLRQRRMMQPLFSAKYLNGLSDVMVDAIDKEIARMARHAGQGQPAELGGAMTALTQRVLLETMFGASLSGDDADRLGTHIVDALRVINIKVFLFFLPEAVPIPGARRLRDAVRAIDTAMLSLVGERRRHPRQRDDLLSLLLQARDGECHDGMDDRQLRDELVNLLVAGNDTTANALTFFWYLLSVHPEVERRVRDEVDSVLGGRRPSAADVACLTFTRAALQEAMRLYPPVWMIPRFCVADDVIDGFPIQAGAAVLVLPWLTHRDPALWRQPDEFDPDRFLPEQASRRERFAYFPFGGGARQCIGSSFALLEAVLVIARVVQSLELRALRSYRLVPSSTSTLKPKGGLPMFIQARKTPG